MKSPFASVLASLCALTLLFATSPVRAQNPVNPLDVNNDGQIQSLDALIVINDLLGSGSRATAFTFHDVTGDAFITPIDSLRPTNYFNAHGSTVATPGGGGPENTTVPAHAAQISLVVADTSDVPISSISVGQQFHLQIMVQDTRPSPEGVYAAYTDATYPTGNVGLAGSPYYGPGFVDVFSTDTSVPGLAAHAGGFMTSLSAPGGSPQYMMTIPMVALAPGIANFGAGASGLPPITDILLYGLDVAVPAANVDFLGASLTIVPEPASIAMAALGCLALAGYMGIGRRRHR